MDARLENPSLIKLPSPWRVLRVALMLGCLSFVSTELNLYSCNAGGVSLLWPTNGLLMGVLLCTPRRNWPVYLTVAAIIDLVVNLSLNNPFYIALYLSSCNLLEAASGALLLYGVVAARPDLTERRQLVAFLGYGVLLAPLLASFAASFAQNGYFAPPSFRNVQLWFSADALGVATVTPLYLAFHRKDRFGGRSWREVTGLFALLGLVTFGVFWQGRFPLFFVVTPFLLLLGLRLRLAGSALGLLVISIIGGLLSTLGHGPIGLVRTGSQPERDLVFQVFIAVSMLMLYIVEVRLAESERLRSEREDSERRFRLLAEASSDIIILSDLDNRRHYVSPAITEVLGWMPQEALASDFRQSAHPDDEAALERLFRDCRDGAPAESLEYRARKADGGYAWLEVKPRLYCDAGSGEPAGFVTVARDISRRKMEEAEEQKAFETMEQLASSDPLTGVANRRHFDKTIESEWLRAAREQSSLSLLLLDVDCFKRYNDIHGHVTGDECLRQVVAAIQPVVCRPADLLARYGGEEFIIVLPDTEASGARQMAEWIRQAVEAAGLDHPGNPPHGVITVSVGCATLVPHPEITHLHLLEAADQALYQAKSQGRNRISMAGALPGNGSVLVMG